MLNIGDIVRVVSSDGKPIYMESKIGTIIATVPEIDWATIEFVNNNLIVEVSYAQEEIVRLCSV